ncbi:MAG: 3-deoxy-7-phosphoheptulonate synthase [Gammaproteobacteria bacterium]|nr:3-deoxy-7-phosphoheptulonate synthase [Gammaproteobacteria bacterium]MDH4254862.1 3-deoxy-7-phosphoheptulonate synthase [Gammaproteobacteria bacterium]MDH5310194.1 3-deoxy-7-phosphoheptulonate synthase [Gammaproteobacteria bacterium]
MTRPVARTDWHPASWQSLTATQQANYPDAQALDRAVADLARLPPLVTSWEVDALRDLVAKAQRGEAFVLQGGDCAESFYDCTSESIVAKLKILLQMSLVMLYGLKKPVVRIGRMAGQYAKPRSADMETREGVTLPSFRGDLVNRNPFTADDRLPDPQLILRGYERAALTLNFVRSLIDGGFADLHHPENWDLGWVGHSRMADRYHDIVNSISGSLDFLESITGRPLHHTQRADIYASHEGLHLLYEQSQTRYLKHRQRWYNLTTHFPWIGMRTTALDGAHVEYFRGIANPIGVKVGGSMTAESLQELIGVLNPNNQPGRLTLIHRFGAAAVEEGLPVLIRAARATGSPVLWVCDPMHGNTESTADGTKTRRFDKIVAELEAAFRIHREMGSHLGGVHLELTGENVTECTGGARGLSDGDLARAYKSSVDPRLNYEQAMEIAMRIAGLHLDNGR